jgi:hypothetical protein
MIRVAGPTTEADALEWTRDAFLRERFRVTRHFREGMSDHDVEWGDVRNIIEKATRCTAYPGTPKNGGTNWRLLGPKIDGDERGIGVEAYADVDGNWVVLVTTF